MLRPPRFLSLMSHVLAVGWLGIMAGFFWAYSANVSLATAQMDGPMYAIVQSELNRHVRHAMFFVLFFGPPAWCAATLLQSRQGWRQGWWWCLAVAALLYLLGIVFFTAQVNLPNNAYTESWNPNALPADWRATREAWQTANLWRTVVSALAFLLACAALAWRGSARA